MEGAVMAVAATVVAAAVMVVVAMVGMIAVAAAAVTILGSRLTDSVREGLRKMRRLRPARQLTAPHGPECAFVVPPPSHLCVNELCCVLWPPLQSRCKARCRSGKVWNSLPGLWHSFLSYQGLAGEDSVCSVLRCWLADCSAAALPCRAATGLWKGKREKRREKKVHCHRRIVRFSI